MRGEEVNKSGESDEVRLWGMVEYARVGTQRVN